MNRFKIILLALFSLPFLAFGQNFTMEYGDDLKYSRIDPSAIDSIRTIEFWFKLNNDYTETALSPQAIIQREDQTGQEQNEFGINLVDFSGRSGHLEFHFNGNRIISDQSFWRADNWYHAAGVIHPTEGMKLYIHGVEQLESNSYNQGIYPTTDTTFIGTWGFKRYRDLDGQLDEIRLWNRALSQEEIIENMCQGLDTNKVDGLAAYYKFEQGKGDTAYDYSTNDYHIMVNNVSWEDDVTCYVSGIEKSLSRGSINILQGNEFIRVKIPEDIQQEDMTFLLFDITGRKILSKKVEKRNSSISIPTTELPKAPVILKLTTNSGVYTGKTIIR